LKVEEIGEIEISKRLMVEEEHFTVHLHMFRKIKKEVCL